MDIEDMEFSSGVYNEELYQDKLKDGKTPEDAKK